MAAEMTLGDYLRVFKRRKHIIFAISVAALGVSLWWAHRLDPIYATTAVIEIRKNLMTEGVGIRRAFISTFEKQTIAKLAENKEIAPLAVAKLAEMYPNRYANIADTEALASSIRQSVGVSLREDANFLEVTARRPSPIEAAEWANAYAEAVIVFHDLDRHQTVAGMLEYLDGQIRFYETKIRELDDRLTEMRAAGRAPDGQEATPDLLVRANAAVAAASAKRQELSDRLDAINQSVGAGDAVRLVDALGAEDLLAEKLALERKQAELAAALERYTDVHPTVDRLREEVSSSRETLLNRALARVDAEKELLAMEIERAETDQARSRVEAEMIRSAMATIPETRRERNELERELQIATSVYQMFRQKKEDIDITLSTVPPDQLLMRDYAAVPRMPLSPDKKMIVGMGLSIGVMLSIAFAFLLESLDTSLIAMRDVERFIEKPILCVIPAIRTDPEKVKSSTLPFRKELLHKLPLLVDSRSPAAEAFRTLRAVLQNRFFKAGKKTLLVTSSTPQEGKTTTTVNLAIACADAGMKTILVGANMRHPVIGRHFKIDRTRGLHDVLTNKISREDSIQATGRENLSIIDSGSFARRPAELLADEGFDELLKWLKDRYDAIIVDSPPALPVADAATIAPKVDGVLIVYLASVAPRDALLRCKETLEEIGGHVIGIVFNDIRGASQDDYAGYYYYHKYAGEEFRRI